MKNLILFLLLFLTIDVFSQSYQIGMHKKELLDSSSNIDSLDDGTIFIKSSTDQKEYYYFFNDSNICFCIVINFLSQEELDNYTKFLKKSKYKYQKEEYWSNKKYFVRIEDIGLEIPVAFIWSNIEIPEDWDYHK